MAFVSTLGAPDANSYLSVAEAATLLSQITASSGVSAWLALTTTQKEQSLVAATMAINPLQWKGQPSSSDQSLAWPEPEAPAETAATKPKLKAPSRSS